MSETTFTPGPWTQNYVGTHGFIVRGGEKSVHVASVLPKQDFVDSAEAKSNAHLIAAAPDLFSALSRLLLIADEKSVVMARAALAKSRGEQHATTRPGFPPEPPRTRTSPNAPGNHRATWRFGGKVDTR